MILELSGYPMEESEVHFPDVILFQKQNDGWNTVLKKHEKCLWCDAKWLKTKYEITYMLIKMDQITGRKYTNLLTILHEDGAILGFSIFQ